MTVTYLNPDNPEPVTAFASIHSRSQLEFATDGHLHHIPLENVADAELWDDEEA